MSDEILANSWDRQEEESAAAYAAFCIYRDLGASRSVDSAAAASRQATGKPQANKKNRAPDVWFSWSSRFQWVARARAYDVYLEQRARGLREAEHMKELEQYRDQARKGAATLWIARNKLMERLTRRLDNINPDQIDVEKLPSFMRAVAYVTEVALNTQAEAIGVRQLETLLDDEGE